MRSRDRKDTKIIEYFRYIDERVRGGDRLFPRKQFGYIVLLSPSRIVSQIVVTGEAGADVDFASSREARGATINFSATLHPTNHLAVEVLRNQRSDQDRLEKTGRQFFAKCSYAFQR